MTTYTPTKRLVTLAVALALVLSLLSVAYGDFGPKPSVRQRKGQEGVGLRGVRTGGQCRVLCGGIQFGVGDPVAVLMKTQ